MPLRNRVDPSGTIFATPARGTFMGNRGGVMHNVNREIVRQYASRRWIACLLEFKGRRRTVMSPHRYTELFFLDEAVALCSGHRPCAECRRDRFRAFQDAWIRSGGTSARADRLSSLPEGCFVQIEGSSYLVWGGALLEWSPAVYVQKRLPPEDLTVTVLTPEPIVRCIRHGYLPAIHKSALAL
jgi:hypothetical protein